MVKDLIIIYKKLEIFVQAEMRLYGLVVMTLDFESATGVRIPLET